MNIKLQVIDLYPSIKKLIYNDEETIIFSLTSPKGTSHIFNMLDLIEGKVPIIIRLKDEKDLIKIAIYKNELLLSEGEFNYYNETKWINLISNDNFNNDKMKIKIKCQIEENISNNNSYSIIHPSKMYSHKKNYKSSLVNNSKKNLYLEKNNNITLSPNKIIKEKSFKTNFEKKNNSINNKTQINNSNNRKYSSSKLKHNKSCEEGNLLQPNFLEEESQSNPLYNSMICNKKDINEINNSKINKSQKKIKRKKGIMNTLNTVAKFDWSRISPTIFGAIFESTLSAKRRHENGMHYTSVKNIHKVIDNLFLNQIYEDFDKIKVISDDNKRLLE